MHAGSGQALTTRVYRGHPPPDTMHPGISLLAAGGSGGGVVVDALHAYEMGSAWSVPHDLPQDGWGAGGGGTAGGMAHGGAASGTKP